MAEYRTIITTAGQTAFAAAIANGTPVVFDDVAIGDANGVGYDPSELQTALVHEVYRANNDGVEVLTGGVIVVTLHVPATSGGYNVREAGVFSAAGSLLAVVRIADRYKPLPSSGQADELTIQLKLDVGNVGAVTWSIDPLRKDTLAAQLRPDWRSAEGTLSAPPSSPAPGQTWIIGAAPTGAWAGKAGRMAEWTSIGWAIVPAPDRHRLGLPTGDVFYDAATNAWIPDEATSARIGRMLLATPAKVLASADPTGAVTPATLAALIGRTNQTVLGWQATPPGSPAVGDRYIVAAAPTDAWTGQANKIAIRTETGWAFASPLAGLQVQYWSGRQITLRYDGTAWAEDLATTTAAGRVALATQTDVEAAIGDNVVQSRWLAAYARRLSSDTTIYVRADGNDANDGSANTAAKAFRSVQAAIESYIRRFTGSGYKLSIQISAGSYSDYRLTRVPGIIVETIGTGATSTISAGSPATHCILASEGSQLIVRGQALYGGLNQIYANDRARIDVDGVIFRKCAGHLLFAAQLAAINIQGPLQIIGDGTTTALSAMCASVHGVINAIGASLLNSGSSPSYATAFAWGNNGTVLGKDFTSSGGSLGQRYLADTNGYIGVGGQGANVFPGTVAGTTTTGGQYT